MNHLLYLALKKSKLNRFIYRKGLRNHHGSVEVTPRTVAQAERLLQGWQADPHHSCRCQHKVSISPQYDLLIVVPAYNVEKYIRACLDSVLAQKTTFSYLVKVINDGSTDHTAQILASYQDRPAVQVIHQPNKGFSGARNTGLQHIDARYVMFLDSDDLLAPGAIQALLEAALRTGADIVEGSSVKFLGPWVTKHFRHIEAEAVKTDQLFGFPWGKVFRATLFEHVQFPEEYWFEDTVCALILHPMAQHISTITHPVYRYRTNFKGISRNFRGKSKCLDSFYITRQLWADRMAMGWPADEHWAQKLAWQFKLNARRIASLHNKAIDQAVFVLQSQLMQIYFASVKTEDALVQALLEGDYEAFRWQMKWL